MCVSCGHPSTLSSRHDLATLSALSLFHRGQPSCGQRVEPAPRPPLARRHLWILPAALEKPHVFEAGKGAIKRSIGGQQTMICIVFDATRDVIAMKLADALADELCG